MLPGEFFLSSILQEINDQDGWLEISRIHYSERGEEPSYVGVYLVKKLIVASSLSEDVYYWWVVKSIHADTPEIVDKLFISVCDARDPEYMSYEFSPQKLPKGTTTVTVEHISSLDSFADLLNEGEQRIYFPWKQLEQCLSPVAEGYRLLKNSISADRERSVQPKTKEQLSNIILKTIQNDGYECNLNFIDTSNVTDMSGLSDGSDADNILYLNVGSVEARGLITSEGFVLLAGSDVKNKASEKSISKSVMSLRNKCFESGIIKDFKTVEDIIISSSSYAAQFVLGNSVSGPQSWKNKDGITLRELEEKEAENEPQMKDTLDKE